MLPSSSHPVDFSIIVPTYARPAQLAGCLQSVACLDYPRNRFEVIVVDDGSETPPESVLARFHDQFTLRLLSKGNGGPGSARNLGAAHAKGRFLAFTDDDCTPASDWLKKLEARFAAEPECAIGGRTLNLLRDNPYSTASQLLIDYLYSYYNGKPDRARFFAGNNLAMPVAQFTAIGGFDVTFMRPAGEDRELCDRWLRCGYRMIYAPEVTVYHAHGLTLRTFWRQHFAYGRGAFYFHKLRAKHGLGRVRVEPLAFYLDLLRYPYSQGRGKQSLALAALLVVAQAANALGFFSEMASQRKKNGNI